MPSCAVAEAQNPCLLSPHRVPCKKRSERVTTVARLEQRCLSLTACPRRPAAHVLQQRHATTLLTHPQSLSLLEFGSLCCVWTACERIFSTLPDDRGQAASLAQPTHLPSAALSCKETRSVVGLRAGACHWTPFSPALLHGTKASSGAPPAPVFFFFFCPDWDL